MSAFLESCNFLFAVNRLTLWSDTRASLSISEAVKCSCQLILLLSRARIRDRILRLFACISFSQQILPRNYKWTSMGRKKKKNNTTKKNRIEMFGEFSFA